VTAPKEDAARVHSLHVSNGGVPKTTVPQVRVTKTGLAGDWQNDQKHHGGPERAVCAFAFERIEALRAEGHPIQPGSTGENLTTIGLDWDAVGPGTKLKIGADDEAVELEVTGYTEPCRTIQGSFKDGAFVRMKQSRHPGFSRVYLRVLREGTLRIGDPIELV
jgi:MOSC domain-containing protein YiiM